MELTADDLLPGSALFLAPHMDDAILACGGTLAQLSDSTHVHVAYASDGRASPEPVVPWRDRVTDDLFEVRRAEATQAMGLLGVSAERLHFLGLPDARLSQHTASLADQVRALMARVRPDHLLAPFRYDQNPDHLAVHRVARACAGQLPLIEYFVYYRMRLLRGHDLRAYLRPELRLEVPVGPARQAKRAALDCFVSQTTRFYPWQTRPNLTPELLDEVSAAPESFLRGAPSGTSVFQRGGRRISILNRLEPTLKRPKDRLVALLRRRVDRDG